jgi:hypothetical protein
VPRGKAVANLGDQAKPVWTWPLNNVFEHLVYKNDGHQVVYWIDNEHDGLRGQRDLDVTVASWAEELKTAETDNYYLGMAREAGNSPLYVIEMLFYMNIMHPDLVSMDFDDEFFFFIDNFTLETEKYKKEMDIDNFFKAYGFI